MHVRSSLEGSKSLDLVDSVVSESSEQAAPAPRLTRVCVADGPVRIDLAGGWSDTPPICYEASGAVRFILECMQYIKYFHIHII